MAATGARNVVLEAVRCNVATQSGLGQPWPVMSRAVRRLGCGAAPSLVVLLSCAPASTGELGRYAAGPSSESDPAHTRSTISNIVTWVVGERERTVRTDPRGVSLGLLLVEPVLQAAPTTKPLPESCARELQALHPAPGMPGTVFLAGADRTLWRYAEGRLVELSLDTYVPPIVHILGFRAATSPLEMLVEERNREQLWSLTIADDRVVHSKPVSDDPSFIDHDDFFKAYDVGRCRAAGLSCLRLEEVDGDHSLMCEMQAGEGLLEIMPLPEGRTIDVSYADRNIGTIYLLTDMVCR